MKLRDLLGAAFASGAIFVASLLAAGAHAELALDTSFGVDGVAKTAFASAGDDTPHDLVFLPDGRILVAGRSQVTAVGDYIALSRYSADGVPDSSFGTSGKVAMRFQRSDWANSAVLQSDGKIVLGGHQNQTNGTSTGRPCVYRFTASGAPDTTFAGYGGFYTGGFLPFVWGIGNARGEVVGVRLEPSGTIVAAGRANTHINGGANGFGLANFLTNGNLVFSERYGFPVSSQRGAVAFLDDGRVLHANTWDMGSELSLLRMLPDGSCDGTFGEGFCYRFTGLSAYQYHQSMRAVLLEDGKFLVATTTDEPGGGRQFTVFRFESGGLLDTTYGVGGRTDVNFFAIDELHDARLDASGRLLLAGSAGGSVIGVARLLAGGAPDSTFSSDGKTTYDLSGGTLGNYATQLRVLDDGKLLVAGKIAGDGWDVFLARFIVNESPAVTAGPVDQAVCEAAPETLAVSATGTPPLTFQWRKDGVPIGGATDSTFLIASAGLGDAGSYDVVVSNAWGADTSAAAVLSLLEGNTIEQEPASVDACIADTVVLSVSVSGPSPAFQWRKNTVDIPGANDSLLAFSPATNLDSGSYDVVVTGLCGALTSAAAVLSVGSCSDTIFVNAAAPAGGGGESWADALDDLQAALALAAAPDDAREIWVAAGTYTPAVSNRSVSFQLVSKVALYGGFAGGESDRDERDPAANPTLLSGDLSGNDSPNFTNYGDNSFHVINGDAVDSTAILDGFTIIAGGATGAGPGGTGGGVRIYNGGRPTFRRCLFLRNLAINGGALDVSNSSPRFLDCLLAGNRANSSAGAGRFEGVSSASFTNCVLSGNTAGDAGGLRLSSSGNSTIVNCTLSGNAASLGSGGIVLKGNTGQLVIGNSILWGNFIGRDSSEAAQIFVDGPNTAPDVNYCDIQGWTGGLGGTGNVGLDPLFADADGSDDLFGTSDDDVTVLTDSPAIDAGSNALVPAGVAFDLAGLARFVDDPCALDTGSGTPPLVDIGAHEFPGGECTTDVAPSAGVSSAGALFVGHPVPNPTRGALGISFRLPSVRRVVIDVVDVQGRRVRPLVDRELPVGDHTIAWDGRTTSGHPASSGVYHLVLDIGGQRVTRKTLLMR